MNKRLLAFRSVGIAAHSGRFEFELHGKVHGAHEDLRVRAEISSCIRSPLGAAAGLALLTPNRAWAHSFGQVYNLPVPIWMYLWGTAAALAASFLVVAYFISAPSAAADRSSREWPAGWTRRPVSALKAVSVFSLLACIVTGLLGANNSYTNFSMTFFWIVFVLGFTYFTALFGGLYAAINPWQVISEILGRYHSGFARGRVRYPQRLGYWPALLFYMGFIWIELFMHSKPVSLAVILLAYSGINLLGIWLLGRRDWFRYGEFLSVFLRLVAKMAPLEYRSAGAGTHGRLRLRAPFTGLLEERAEHMSLLLFILFMLSSTAFDGLRESAVWTNLFWVDIYQWLKPWLDVNPTQSYAMLRPLYLSWQTLWLLLSPFIYLGLYALFVGLAKWLTRSPLSLRELLLRFAYSLLPIVLVYNITHYYTLILTQGVKIIPLLSDPFGLGWNLFGTATLLRAPIIPDVGWVWHTQVGLILFGHIVSVYIAHQEALRTFATQRQATLSQLPMLVLMVCFTTIGLWILSQPVKPGG